MFLILSYRLQPREKQEYSSVHPIVSSPSYPDIALPVLDH